MEGLTKDNDTQYDLIGNYNSNIEEFTNNHKLRNSVLNKLGQLEDIEEELGCDLITLFKALKHGFFVKKDTINEGLISLVKAKDIRSIDLVTHNIYFNVNNLVFFENYGKTWALTKEELKEE